MHYSVEGVMHKIRICGDRLKVWGGCRRRDFQRELEGCRIRMENFRGHQDERGMREFREAHKNYMGLLELENGYWKQRAKQFWLRDRDRNTRFFHNKAKARRARNIIQHLRDEGGNWVEDRSGVGRVVLGYFENLFTSGFVSSGRVLEGVQGWVSDAQNENLGGNYESSANWRPLEKDCLKMNVDAFVRIDANTVGFGWVVRDWLGHFVAAGVVDREGACLAREAEALAMREALSWLKNANFDNFILETDAKLLLDHISTDNWTPYGLILQDIRHLFSQFSNAIFHFVKRYANFVAQHLVRDASSMLGLRFCCDSGPSFISHALCNDAMLL
nr:Transposon TX1 uncharacterized [Ipomoea batatas]